MTRANNNVAAIPLDRYHWVKRILERGVLLLSATVFTLKSENPANCIVE